MKVCVIGSGTMGPGIAQAFAMKGFDVLIISRKENSLKKTEEVIQKSLDKLAMKSKITAEEKENAFKRLSYSINLEDAGDADLVVETISEDMNAKIELFSRLKEICKPDSIIATNTSSISISKLSRSSNPKNFIGLHFFNPATLMELVEIVVGEQTSEKTKEKAEEIIKILGKKSIIVKDSPAFVTSRLLMLMINEAVFCLQDGIADKKEIDLAMKLGMNHPMGPLELADMVGLDVVLSIIKSMHTGFNDEKYRPCPLLVQMVEQGKLGRKSGEGFYRYV